MQQGVKVMKCRNTVVLLYYQQPVVVDFKNASVIRELILMSFVYTLIHDVMHASNTYLETCLMNFKQYTHTLCYTYQHKTVTFAITFIYYV